MRILVTGATGLVGRKLCGSLSGQGHELVVLSRRPAGVDLPGLRAAFGWNPDSEPSPAAAWEGVEAAIHLAGEPVAESRWTPEQKRRIRDSRVIGTRNLIAGMKELTDRPKVLVGASAVGFYGTRGDETLREESAPGQGFLPDVCIEWEAETLKAAGLGLRVASIRIGVVLSPDGGALKTMLLPFRLGLGGRLGSGRQWFPWIHIDDITGIIEHALFNAQISGPLNGVAPGIVTNQEFTRQLASTLHRPALFPVPEAVIRIMMGEMADVVFNSQRVTPKRALETGYLFRFPQLGPALEDLLG